MSEENLLDSLISAAIEEVPEIENAPNTSGSNSKLTSLHSGDTDSSDDEDNRDFENKKYNESGRDIKHLLNLNKPENKTEFLPSNKTSSLWKLTPAATSAPKVQANWDSVFGIRVVNPLISTKILEDRMVGREFIPMLRIKSFVRNVPKDKDWVIAGVIVHKSGPKTSQKGKDFCIWTLSDLKSDLKTISLFLFGGAFRELWKTVVGTAIGVLNPSVMDVKEGSKDEACLNVMNHQRVMVIGQSKDLGTCKSIKKSGERCTAFVNKSLCEFCLYHIKQEYQKVSSKRSDLQANFSGGGLTALRNKVLGKDQVFYAGKLYTSIPAKKSKKQTERDEGRLRALAGHPILAKKQTKKTKQAAAQLEMARDQRRKDLARLKQLGIGVDLSFDGKVMKFNAEGVSRNVTVNESRSLALDVIDRLKMNKNKSQEDTNESSKSQKDNIEETKENFMQKCDGLEDVDLDIDFKKQEQNVNTNNDIEKWQKNSSAKSNNRDGKSNRSENVITNGTKEHDCINPKQPQHSNALQSSLLNHFPTLSGSKKLKIDLSLPIKQKKAVKAKQNALAWVQNNGPIKKEDPNNIRGSEKGKKRALEALNELDVTKPQEVKKSKIEENEFFSERFKKMMAATSKHMDLLEQRDNEEQEEYFNKLEMKERMEEKMLTTYKMPCKAVRCLKCKYTNFSASDLCKKEKHPLKVFDATKRFFKCGDCSNRTVSLALIPTHPCKNCGSSRWEKTSMMKERKVEIAAPKLSIRGGEQKFTNSVVGDANLDLLVPDD